jgi:glycosyltransferase involved in cell wall biosynthesis
VARLAREKDFPTLLRAVHRALPHVPELELRIVGDGPVRPDLERLAGELGLGSHVRFLGERADVPGLLADAGFFVTSTLTEGISLTLLEAAAVGLPILATNVGGNPEIVVDNVTGRLVPAADPEVLAEALVALCHKPDEWTTMGRLGRERVLEHFDVRRMVREYEDLYASFQCSVFSNRAEHRV